MKKYKIILGILILPLLVSSCELFGLDYQENDDYEISSVNNQLNMSVYDFILSRPDIFSTLKDGIEYAGIQDLYNQSDNTYLLLTNQALSNLDDSNCWFRQHPVPNPAYDPSDPMSSATIYGVIWEQYSKEEVKELLTYHIIKGTWTLEKLGANKWWLDTYAPADTAKIRMWVSYTRECYLYSDNFRVDGTVENLRPRTPNLWATNGYVHVYDRYINRPTKNNMGLE